MSGAHPDDAGLASGLINTTTQVGGALGLAVLATLAAERTNTLRASGDSAAQALNGGYHLGYLVAAGLTLVAFLIAAFLLRQPSAQAAAQAEAEPAYAEAA
jgi:hypothetical protein